MILDDLLKRLTDWLLTSGLHVLVMVLVLFLFLKAVEAIGRRILKFVEDDDPTTLSDREKRAHTLIGIMNTTAQVIALLVFVYTLLRELGVNVAPLLAGAGIAGIAVGFGAQTIVKDIFNGFFILFENQFRQGDVIRIGDVTGTVEEMRLRTTILRDVHGSKHIIPNSQISQVSNLSFQWSVAVIDVGVSYSADIDRVAEVLGRVGRTMGAEAEWSGRILEPVKVLGVESFGDSAVNMRAVIKTQAQEQWAVAREYRKRLKAAFDAEGIEMPYPQMVVHQAPAGK
ncbi:MAG: mechanosensitive ion channel family protein [Myxococcota bacterium]|jgi:small conductance mechanosensitive channel